MNEFLKIGVIRSRRGRGRPSGSSRGVSESSLEGHDADVYEFNDTEEEEAVVSTHAISTPLEIAESKTVLHDVVVPTGSQQVLLSSIQYLSTSSLNSFDLIFILKN